MSLFKELSKEEVEVVHDWLRTMGLPVNRTIHRDYADGVWIAKLLKRIYPRIVDLHYYEPRYSTHLKTVNWETLNFNVLRRIGLPLCRERIDRIVQCEVGAIEGLVWALMKHTIAQRPKQVQACLQSKPIPEGKATVHPSNIPYLSNLNSLSSFNSILSNLNNKGREKIGDSQISKSIPRNLHERALNEARRKVATLENLLKQRESDISVLLDRVKVYETENREFRKVFSEIFNERLSEIEQKPAQHVRFDL